MWWSIALTADFSLTAEKDYSMEKTHVPRRLQSWVTRRWRRNELFSRPLQPDNYDKACGTERRDGQPSGEKLSPVDISLGHAAFEKSVEGR